MRPAERQEVCCRWRRASAICAAGRVTRLAEKTGAGVCVAPPQPCTGRAYRRCVARLGEVPASLRVCFRLGLFFFQSSAGRLGSSHAEARGSGLDAAAGSGSFVHGPYIHAGITPTGRESMEGHGRGKARCVRRSSKAGRYCLFLRVATLCSIHA